MNRSWICKTFPTKWNLVRIKFMLLICKRKTKLDKFCKDCKTDQKKIEVSISDDLQKSGFSIGVNKKCVCSLTLCYPIIFWICTNFLKILEIGSLKKLPEFLPYHRWNAVDAKKKNCFHPGRNYEANRKTNLVQDPALTKCPALLSFQINWCKVKTTLTQPSK